MAKGGSAPQEASYSDQLGQNIQAGAANSPAYIAALQQYGPQLTGVNTNLLGTALQGQLNNATQLQPQLTQLQTNAQNQYISSNPLLQQLQNQAQISASDTGALNPAEQQAITQSSLAPYAGTGMVGSNAAQLTNILNRGQYSTQRRAQSLGQASSLEQLLAGVGGQASSAAMSYANPSLGGSTAVQGQNIINPTSQYAQNINDTNFNAQTSAYNAQQNNSAGLFGGLIKAGTSLGGAYINSPYSLF